MKLNINDSQGIELLNFIFERELKPPFRKGEKDEDGDYPYYNRDGEYIGYLDSIENAINVKYPFVLNIKYKVCQAFEFPYNTRDWWDAINPHLKSWIENQINLKLRRVST